MEFEKNRQRGLSHLQQFSFGVGHVINDNTRRMLHSFRMIFLMRVVGISATNAGLISSYNYFAGGILFAPVAGFLCDKIKIPVLSRRHGKRKSWHLIGTIAAAIGIPLFFSKCFVCDKGTSEWPVLLYYFLIATMISFSINFVDISHLSVIPVLAKDQREAAKLSSLRTAFMYLTGVICYLVAWLILGQDGRDQLSKESSMDFMVIALILTGVGLVCSGIFHVGTKEPPDDSPAERKLSHSIADYVRKTSFMPSAGLLQSVLYFEGYQQRKENILDKFIHSLRSLENNNPTNQQLCEEQTSPVRKSSFFDQFFEAILAGNDSNEAAESKTIEKEAHDPTPNLTVTPVAVTSEDDFAFVKTLPKERKISLMMSIFNRLTTKQEDSPRESDLKKDDYRTLDDIGEGDGRGMMEKIQQNSEIVNQGHKLTPAVDLEEFETESSQHSPDVSKDDRKALPSVASDIESTPLPKAKTARAWFKDPHLYKVAIIYSCTKSLQSVLFSYLPLLLTDELKFGKEAIANIPLIALVSATLSTEISRRLSRKVGNKWTFTAAAATVIGSCAWFLNITQSTRVSTYPAVILLGFGSSAMFVNALGFATELIGDNKGSSGLVFSVIGTLANLTLGTLYIVIQALFPKESASTDCQECGNYVRRVFAFVPSSLAAFSLLLVIIFQVPQIVCGKKETEKETESDSGHTT